MDRTGKMGVGGCGRFGAWYTHQPSSVTNSANARLRAAQRPHSLPFNTAFISQGEDCIPANTVIDPCSPGAGMRSVQVTAQSALKQLHFTPLTATERWLPGAATISSAVFAQLTNDIEFPLVVACTCDINTCLLVLLT